MGPPSEDLVPRPLGTVPRTADKEPRDDPVAVPPLEAGPGPPGRPGRHRGDPGRDPGPGSSRRRDRCGRHRCPGRSSRRGDGGTGRHAGLQQPVVCRRVTGLQLPGQRRRRRPAGRLLGRLLLRLHHRQRPRQQHRRARLRHPVVRLRRHHREVLRVHGAAGPVELGAAEHADLAGGVLLRRPVDHVLRRRPVRPRQRHRLRLPGRRHRRHPQPVGGPVHRRGRPPAAVPADRVDRPQPVRGPGDRPGLPDLEAERRRLGRRRHPVVGAAGRHRHRLRSR